ncbi:MAG: CPBP family intramembrane metalloprotease, partial [Pirellulales bacterium]|nr:CPBP family intramembrane metalloprotease [Pirellulales bacterium]
YILNFILKQAYELVVEEEAAHPIEKMMLSNPSTGVLFWAFCTAVIAAPLVEEFLFRVILQGWLEKAFVRTKRFAEAQTAGEEVTEEQLSSQSPNTTFMWQPIVLSSITFALPHAGHGPDPIPLFFLAMVLGYLYAKTHRILPGIVVHMALNGTSMLILLTGL